MISSSSVVLFRGRGRRTRRPIRIVATTLILIALVGFVGSFGLSYSVAANLIHRACVPLKTSPQTLGLPYKNIVFPSRLDALNIHGWLVPSANQNGKIVILAHGYHGNRTDIEAALPTAKALWQSGFSVMMFDFRAEGQGAIHVKAYNINPHAYENHVVDFITKYVK